VPEDNNVKLVALTLSKCRSLWWRNVIKKRAMRNKPKIRILENMRTKFEDWFVPSSFTNFNKEA